MTTRNFSIAHGVKISADPETLTKDQLIDELYDIANYASLQLIAARTLRGVLQNAITKGGE